jgi:hypothetical protein
VCSVAAGLVRAGRVDPEAYRRAVTELGEDGLVELVLTVGYYVLVALTVNTVDADLPPGTAPVW